MKITPVDLAPPEETAVALARFSRSAQSYEENRATVTAEKSAAFHERYTIGYGHSSVADLAQVGFAIEDVSLLAAIVIEDEVLWQGQERSTRYQDFSTSGYYTPAMMSDRQARDFDRAICLLLASYIKLRDVAEAALTEYWSANRPLTVNDAQFKSAITARAFDCARVMLPLAMHTSVAQITNARTLAGQVARLKATPNKELVQIGIALEHAAQPQLPTLLRHTELDAYRLATREIVKEALFDIGEFKDTHATDRPYQVHVHSIGHADQEHLAATNLLFEHDPDGRSWPGWFDHLRDNYHANTHASEMLRQVLLARGPHDQLPKAFQSAPYLVQFYTDVGSYRDLHRHRRTVQFRGAFGPNKQVNPVMWLAMTLGPATAYLPDLQALIQEMHHHFAVANSAQQSVGSPYPLPLGSMVYAAFYMDLAEAVYIAELRSKAGGHPAYRHMANSMASALMRFAPITMTLRKTHPVRDEDIFLRG